MKEMKKLIRGVIYDNPNLVEEELYNTVDAISGITDDTQFIEQNILPNMTMGYIPTVNEYITSVVLGTLSHNNLVVPKNLVDDRLYSCLDKIDIGKNIVEQYIISTSEKNSILDNKNNEGFSIVIKEIEPNGNTVSEKTFTSKADAVEEIIKRHVEKFGDTKADELNDIISKILAA